MISRRDILKLIPAALIIPSLGVTKEDNLIVTSTQIPTSNVGNFIGDSEDLVNYLTCENCQRLEKKFAERKMLSMYTKNEIILDKF